MDNKDNTSLFEAYEQVLTSDIGPCEIHNEVWPLVARAAPYVARGARGAYRLLRKAKVPKKIAKPIVRGPGAGTVGTGVGVGLAGGGSDGEAGDPGAPGAAGAAAGAAGANLDSDGDGIPDSQDPDNQQGAGGGTDRDEEDVKMKTATYQLQLPEIYAQQIYDQLGGQLGAGKGMEREVDDEQEREAGEGEQAKPSVGGAAATPAESPSTVEPTAAGAASASSAVSMTPGARRPETNFSRLRG